MSKKLTTSSAFKGISLNLIDFRLASKYTAGRDGKHIFRFKNQPVKGTTVFSSTNVLEYYITSRRDDLVSLLYMMVYLLNRGNLLDIKSSSNFDPLEI